MKKLFAILVLAAVSLGAHAFKTDTVKVATKYLATPLDVTVITPEQGLKGESCPTVYILNGYSGNHKSWGSIQPRLGELADYYGMVFVMPDGRDTWYWDSPEKPEFQMESFFTKDLVPYIDNNYPTRRDARYRAITGLSMGGHGSFWLAARHPDLFGSMGSMSGGLDIRPFPKSWKMYTLIGDPAQKPERWEEYTVANLVPQIKANGQNITFDCGTDDFFATVNENMHKALLDAKVPHDYASRPGAHTFKYWANSILYHLLFFNEAFKKADTPAK